MTDYKDFALEIMALVDEYPSEPFSFERKAVIEKLEMMVAQHTHQIEGELDDAFSFGLDEGKRQAEADCENEIRELQEQLEEAQRDIETLTEDNERAFSEGYETAVRHLSS